MPPRRDAKRAFDVVVSALLIVVLAPLFLLIALLVWANLGRPILFRQQRPGFRGEVFELIKFRSMLPAAGQTSERERLTTFGQRLRRSGLDELPQLFNILRGEMSLVGPRPLLLQYLPLYSERHQRRHDVRPGLTGPSQIRKTVSWPEQLETDVRYVESRSLTGDLAILLKTVPALINRRRSQAANAMRGAFSGYPRDPENLPTDPSRLS